MAITEMGLSQELGQKGFELKSYTPDADGSLLVEASKLHAVVVNGQDLYVPVPISLHVKLDKQDHIASLEGSDTDPQSISSAEHFVSALADNNQIDGLSGQSFPHATHKIEIGSDGKKVVRRQGYSL